MKAQHRTRQIFQLNDCRGQMAIFIALIFQVLFVLFAMAINVALIVHDKINLQNSVDLAAYYAAQRQAEILNAIAHQNYLIRQSWKLLAWRYRVLGLMGLNRSPYIHPASIIGNQGYDRREEPFFPATDYPGVCISFQPIWEEAPPDENPCNEVDKHIPALPIPKVIAGFAGINHLIRQLSLNIRDKYAERCSHIGAFNWWFANAILHAFRQDQKNRKAIIYALAQNLSRPDTHGDFLDIRGQSVFAGVQNVVLKNLTYANREGGANVQMLNSLAGISPKTWLPEINILPMLFYLDASEGEGRSCTMRRQPFNVLPALVSARNFLDQVLDPGGQLRVWSQDGVFGQEDGMILSLGVEKNPWVQAYVAVQATTQSRQLFMPFGGSVTITARAYAKPFGGRIGPWYSHHWPRGSQISTGKKVDALVPPRINLAQFRVDDPMDPTRFPNYSRFPGDQMGLNSKLAQAALNGQSKMKTGIKYFTHIVEAILETGANNDILAWRQQNPQDFHYRSYELAAIAPDLFDITYYSVEPNFGVNYLRHIEAAKPVFGIQPEEPVRGDLGSRRPDVPNFNIQDQMKNTKEMNLHGQEAFYFVKEKENLLTGWVPNANYGDYSQFPARFGKCSVNDDERPSKVPGSCINGGRVGYSVKLISRRALLEEVFPAGGLGEAPGPILNPPPQDW